MSSIIQFHILRICNFLSLNRTSFRLNYMFHNRKLNLYDQCVLTNFQFQTCILIQFSGFILFITQHLRINFITLLLQNKCIKDYCEIQNITILHIFLNMTYVTFTITDTNTKNQGKKIKFS